MKTLFKTSVGSHMWKQNHPGSDIDLFVAFQAPSREILVGHADMRSRHDKDETHDDAVHEIGHVVDEVLKGNVNFLWGVFSPIVVEDPHGHLAALRPLALKNMSRQCYNSIHGLAYSNYKKYIESGKDASPKRCNTIARTIGMGVTLLLTGKIVFNAVRDAKPEDILDLTRHLDEAKDESILPDKPQHAQELYDWLLQLRLKDLEEAEAHGKTEA